MSKFYKEDLAYIHDDGFGFFAEAAFAEVMKQLRKRKIINGLIVDLGCGSGILAGKLVSKGYKVLGADYSNDMIKLARKRAPKARFKVCSVYDLNIPECSTVVSTGEVFNYAFYSSAGLQRMSVVFKKIHKALPKDGFFLFDILQPGIYGNRKGRGKNNGD